MKITFQFALHSYAQEKPVSLRFILYISGEGQKKMSTRVRVLPSEWNRQKQKPKTTCVNRKLVNAEMNRYTKAFERVFMEHPYSNLQEFSDRMIDILEPTKTTALSFGQKWDSFISANNYMSATVKKFNTTFKYVCEFDKNVSIQRINTEWILGFKKFLFDEKNLTNSTASKYMKALGVFLRFGVASGEHDNRVYENKLFKIGLEGRVQRLALKPNELERLKDAELKPYHNKVRKILLFLCYTGMRYSDLNRTLVYRDRIEYIPQKTAITSGKIIIPITRWNDYVLNIHDEFNGVPSMSNQVFNREVKVVAKICGIDREIQFVRVKDRSHKRMVKPAHELITSHTGRRTFVTSIMNMGLPIPQTMKLSGHTNIRSLQLYEQSDQQTALDAFRKLTE